jgi:radical SAM protein with 4Fe4S-binding SPASM domain
MYRVTRNGSPSWPIVEKNILRFKEIFRGNTTIHGCVNKKTLPFLYENFKYYFNLGFFTIWYMPVHTEDWTVEDVDIYDNQLSLIFDHMIKNNTVSAFAPINKGLSGNCKHSEKPCGAGNDFVSVTPRGDIWPCHNIYFNDKEQTMKIGNVLTGIEDRKCLDEFTNYTYRDLGCEGCKNTSCYRCVADNWVVNHDITKQVGKPVRCMFSAVEKKWQDIAYEYAKKHFGQPQNMEQRIGRLEEIVAAQGQALELLNKFLDSIGSETNGE